MDTQIQLNAVFEEVRQQRDFLAQRCMQLAAELASARAALSALHAAKKDSLENENTVPSEHVRG
jgi:hypothetical protein